MANIRMVQLHFHQNGWLFEKRRVALAILQAGERVSETIIEAAAIFMNAAGQGDCYAFVRSIPAGAHEFAEVVCDGGVVVLVQAAWVPAGQVAVGRGGLPVRPGLYVGDKPYMEVAHG